MKVLFVANNIYIPGNGISTSARNTVKYLKAAGVDARFLSGMNKDKNGPQPDFPLKRLYFPFFQHIIDANGFSYAVRQRKMIRKAIEWADIVHLEEPLFLQEDAIRYAEKLGKPITGTFHLYTQNILNEIPMASWKWSNDLLMRNWKRLVFDHCSDIQCPTRVVKELLESYNFNSRLHVISNGIKIPAHAIKAEAPQTSPYLILNTGRYVNVKGQHLLLEAMRYSRYSREIQLYFAGNGTNYCKLKKSADRLVKEGILKHAPTFAFHTHSELMSLAKKSYLYVHCATMEVEGLGCIEAVREGTVPLVPKGQYIGTSDFAMDDRSIFPSGDVKALAEKIDWWIEHPEERLAMGRKYADFARNFSIHNSIDALIRMFEGALQK